MKFLSDFLSQSAVWGVLLTLAAFALGTLLNRRAGKAILNPLLLGSIFVIVFLSILHIPYADYKASAAPVNYLLLPAQSALRFRSMKSSTCSAKMQLRSLLESRWEHCSA